MVITTRHGRVQTPVFMPVGTAASVKALSPADLKSIGTQIILANNYHLYLRPGPKALKNLGGIHSFMNWDRPVLTDSGGFQLMSLGKEDVSLCRIDDAGVTFRSHLDGGSLHRFTPEIAIRSQMDIGADIIMAFDCPVPIGADYQTAKVCIRRTHAWLTRCIQVWDRKSQLFGIIQGGPFPDLLRESAKFVIDQDLPGIAVGGAVIDLGLEHALARAAGHDQFPQMLGR